MAEPLLMVAYQCGPGMGSVSQIGWEWYARMARRRPVCLITHCRNRVALEAQGGPLPGSVVHYVDTEWLAGPLYRSACRLFPGREHAVFLLSSLDYYLFDRLALRQAQRWQRAGQRWSAVHVPTPVSAAAATCLDRLGLPLLRGPLNCGLGNPAGFDAVLRQESQWLNGLRHLGRLAAGWIERGASRRVTLTANRATLAALPPAQRAGSRMLLENGIDPQAFRATPWPAPPRSGRPLKVLFVGRMQPVKGVDLLLRAVARLVQEAGLAVELTLVGDGGARPAYEQLARQLGIAQACRFVGNVPLEAVPRWMQACHVFCLPSVRESGGSVLLEAMASARPVIAFRHGGPAELVDEACGVLLDANGPDALVAGLYAALLDCWRNPERWAAMGRSAALRMHAPHPLGLRWEDKLDVAERLYDAMPAGAAPQGRSRAC